MGSSNFNFSIPRSTMKCIFMLTARYADVHFMCSTVQSNLPYKIHQHVVTLSLRISNLTFLVRVLNTDPDLSTSLVSQASSLLPCTLKISNSVWNQLIYVFFCCCDNIHMLLQAGLSVSPAFLVFGLRASYR